MRRLLSLCLVLLALAGPLAAREQEPLSVYQSRRAALVSKFSNGITVLFGTTERTGGDLYGFRQDRDFYYLTGFPQPAAILVLAPAAAPPASGAQAKGRAREILFLPSRNPVEERWTGPKLHPAHPEVRAQTGFETVLPAESFSAELTRLLESYSVLYTILPKTNDPDAWSLERERLERLKKLAPFAEVRDAAPEIGRLRQVKSDTEITLIEKATKLSVDAHRKAMKAMRPGMFEYEIASLMQYTFQKGGAERQAYAPIVGSGFNSTVLHYNANGRRMDSGEVVVIDVGAEYGGYAADITRTLPVSGKFTPRQREIYEIVLGAQKAALAAARPGMVLRGREGRTLHQVAYDYINSRGKDLKGEPLGKYFIHGLGHHVGLYVHDAGDPSRPLEAGMVITIEPGIYIPEEQIGVRIEDMVLVTKDGARVLSADLPREADDVERAMQR